MSSSASYSVQEAPSSPSPAYPIQAPSFSSSSAGYSTPPQPPGYPEDYSPHPGNYYSHTGASSSLPYGYHQPHQQQQQHPSFLPPPWAYQPYFPPCKCELANQIRYYNHRTKEFYYHNAMQYTTPSPAGDEDADARLVDPPESQPPGGNFAAAQFPPCNHYYDPYGPYIPPAGAFPPYNPYGVAPPPPDLDPSSSYDMGGAGGGPRMPPPYHMSTNHHYQIYTEFGICEAVLIFMALLLWLYSFYRLWLVWQKTLNFSESSIQGPQGWDLLVNWVMERIRIKKLKVPGITGKRRSQHHHHSHHHSHRQQQQEEQGFNGPGDNPGEEDALELSEGVRRSSLNSGQGESCSLPLPPRAENNSDQETGDVIMHAAARALKDNLGARNDRENGGKFENVDLGCVMGDSLEGSSSIVDRTATVVDMSQFNEQRELKQYLTSATVTESSKNCSSIDKPEAAELESIVVQI